MSTTYDFDRDKYYEDGVEISETDWRVKTWRLAARTHVCDCDYCGYDGRDAGTD